MVSLPSFTRAGALLYKESTSTFYTLVRAMSLASGEAKVEVEHDEAKQLFYIQLNKDERAVLEYKRDHGQQLLDMYHTGVPPSHQGKGIAAKLVKAALLYVEEKEMLVKPSCTYIQNYIAKHQDEEFTRKHVTS